MKLSDIKLSSNQKAMAGFAKVFVGLILFSVAVYSDIMFVQIMWKTFPDGFVKVLSIMGAVATAASVLLLVVSEAYWFSRGPQMVFSWFFTGAEVIVSVLNVMLAFQMTSHTIDGFMQIWLQICPATPFIAFVGWIIVLKLDTGQKARHDQQEHEEIKAELTRQHEREKQIAELEHAKATHEATMELKKAYLEHHAEYLKQEVNNPQVQEELRRGAKKLAQSELRSLTGLSLPTQFPALPAPQQQVSLAQQAPAPQIPDVMSSEQPTEQERVFTLDELKVALEQAYDRGHQDAQKVSSPLTQPQVETGSQAGMNGNGSH